MLIVLSVVLFLISNILGASILGIVPTPSYSHQVVYQPLWNELSIRGHHVTVLTTNPVRDSTLINLTEIDLSIIYDVLDHVNINKEFSHGPFYMTLKVFEILDATVQFEMEHPEVQALLNNSTAHFDVVLVEGLTPVMFYFAERFKCPFIQLWSMEAPARLYSLLGNPTSPAVYPDIFLPFSGQKELNFQERLTSVAYVIFEEFVERLIHYPQQEKLVRKYFGDGYPSIREMESKSSAMFTNTDWFMHPIRPLSPNVVSIGQFFRPKSQKVLSHELKNRLDSTNEHGFIYFSLGGNLKSKNLPPKTISEILQVFGTLPQLVLWKFELENLTEKPSNVIISNWFPQPSILEHHNIRLFITQGGLQSMEEAIHACVPMLAIPFFGDQYKNSANILSKRLGLTLDIKSFDKTTFTNNIKEIIYNPEYKSSITKLSNLVRDQPMTGLERAIWWTEYIIRNKGAKHLQSQSLEMPWYQYFILDVIMFVITVIVVVVLFFYKIVILLKRWVSKSKKLKIN